MRKQEPSEYKRILRKEMLRKIEPTTALDYSNSHLESAHASVHRAFVDWKTITANLGRQKFHTTPVVTVGSLGEIIGGRFCLVYRRIPVLVDGIAKVKTAVVLSGRDSLEREDCSGSARSVREYR